jgi:Mrp family chromosome partitioning ATPase
VDRIVVVVRASLTPKQALQDALSSLDQSKILGVVLNQSASRNARR